MKRKTSVADAHVFWKYYYDYKNRMTGAERFEPDAAGTNAERTRAVRYIYDPLGRRIMKGVKDGAQDIALNRWTLMRKYIYDGDDIVQEYTWDDDVNIDRLTSRWTHGPGVDEPLVWWYDPDQMDSDTALKPFFYHHDGLGSVTAITDSAGEIVAKYVYDAFGGTVQQCGALAERNFYQYTSREYDSESGLVYFRGRTGDLKLGRFYQEDPIFDSNAYSYISNSPIMNIDPYGLLDMKLYHGNYFRDSAIKYGASRPFANKIRAASISPDVKGLNNADYHKAELQIGPANWLMPPGSGPTFMLVDNRKQTIATEKAAFIEACKKGDVDSAIDHFGKFAHASVDLKYHGGFIHSLWWHFMGYDNPNNPNKRAYRTMSPKEKDVFNAGVRSYVDSLVKWGLDTMREYGIVTQ